MAKIFKTNDQEKALREIIDSLKIINTINIIMKDENIRDLKVRLIGQIDSGSLNEVVPMPFTVIASQLKDYRKRLIKEVLDKSKTYSIRLEDEENEILGIRVKKEPEVVLEAEPVQVEDAADEEPEAETPVTEELSFY
jgi:hypothetical protein